MATKCITDAENEVRKKLSRRYDMASSYFGLTTSATTTPPIVTSITEQWAEGLMWIRNSRGQKESIARGEKLMKIAGSNLDDICAGLLDLVDTAGSLIPERSGRTSVLCNTTDYSPTFNEDGELDWEVSSEKLDDISDERD